ncbi:MAG: hypothetical protein EA398_05130 [Deltaproteobacteria bacterium]|nr:MAG: hypothetical protein EA398_05130 [Deltaproteobacteria bacterium]
MSENDTTKKTDETETMTEDSSDESREGEETAATGASEGDSEATSADDGRTEAGEAEDSEAVTAASDDASDAAPGEDDGEMPTQEDGPDAEELAAAAAEVVADDNIEAGPDDASDPSEFRNLVANAAGITGPDQPKAMFASEDPNLTDDELRAMGIEKDIVPNAPLLVLVVVLTIGLGLIALGGVQLYRFAMDGAMRAGNWSVVDSELAEQRASNQSRLSEFGEAWGETQEGEYRMPVDQATALLLQNPEWLALHPLGVVVEDPTEALPVVHEPTEGEEGDATDTEEAAEAEEAEEVEPPGSEQDEESLDPDGDETHDTGGEAVEEQADTPPPTGDDEGAEAPGEED